MILSSLDSGLFNLFHQFSGRAFLLDAFFIFFARYLPHVLILAFLFFLFKEKNLRTRVLMFSLTTLTVIFSRGIITEIIRFIYYRPRPFEALGFQSLIPENGASFPSGHAAFFFALALSVFYFQKQWGVWFLVLAFLNGLARIYVGVHWPLDILGGIIAAFISFFLTRFLLGMVTAKEKLKFS